MDEIQTKGDINYWNLIEAVWRKKRSIIAIVGITTILAISISLLLSNKYRSTAIVLPDSQGGKAGALGGLSDLAALAGVSVGGDKSWADLYPNIIISESVLKNVIYSKFKSKDFKDSVNLIEYLEYNDENAEKNYDKTLESFRKSLEINADKRTKILTISIVLDDSKLAADIINIVLKELDNFIRTKRISSASERRKWIDTRLSDVQQDLTSSENNLREFRERNRVISNSPQLLLEQQRLIRKVEINSTLFVELKKQLELAKIDEINTMPIINILDAARQTTIKESPRRSVIVIVVFLFALSFTVGGIIIVTLYGGKLREFKTRLSLIAPRK